MTTLKKIWHFIWEEDSWLSWVVNIILAFIIIKFLLYPGLGLILSTSHPIVAVVSSSMEHDAGFDEWWQENEAFYSNFNITQQEFSEFSFKNGFNKGDIMFLGGKSPEKIVAGDIIVYRSRRPDPIIHRVIDKWQENGDYYFQTKGDNNAAQIKTNDLDETKVAQGQIIGRALSRIPLLGYIKIGFVGVIDLFR